MVGGLSKKTTLLCAIWMIGTSSFTNLNSLHKSTSVEVTLHNFAKAITNFAPILQLHEVSPGATGAINLLGQSLQLVTDFKKAQSRAMDSAALSKKSKPSKSKTDAIDSLLNLVTQVASLPSVGEESVLKLFVLGSIRTDQRVLFESIIADKNGSSRLVGDFFIALRGEVSNEVVALANASQSPEVWAKMRDFFQQYFGVQNWNNAFSAWLNCIIDTTQTLMNAFIDTAQQGLQIAVDQIEASQGNNPLVNMLVDQVETCVQNQIDQLQAGANTFIDNAQKEQV
jgi:hypothetical protein